MPEPPARIEHQEGVTCYADIPDSSTWTTVLYSTDISLPQRAAPPEVSASPPMTVAESIPEDVPHTRLQCPEVMQRVVYRCQEVQEAEASEKLREDPIIAMSRADASEVQPEAVFFDIGREHPDQRATASLCLIGTLTPEYMEKMSDHLRQLSTEMHVLHLEIQECNRDRRERDLRCNFLSRCQLLFDGVVALKRFALDRSLIGAVCGAVLFNLVFRR